MGYSASKRAFDALHELMKLQQPHECSNSWYNRGREYFYEIGKEQRDCAITGKVHRVLGGNIISTSSFRIEPDGTITRFAGVNRTDYPGVGWRLVMADPRSSEWERVKPCGPKQSPRHTVMYVR